MNSRLDILFLAHRVPYPPNRGDRIRSWHILRFLAERADVHLACTTDEPVAEDTIRVLSRHCKRLHVQPLSRVGRWIRGAWSLAAGRSATEGLFASRKLQRVVGDWSRDTRFHSVFVFCSSMFQFIPAPLTRRVSEGEKRVSEEKSPNPSLTRRATSELAGARVVVDLVDVDSEKWRNYAATAPAGKRHLYRLESNHVRRLETQIARQADAVTLVSDDEVRVFREFCPAGNVHAVNNGVDLDYFYPEFGRQRSEVGESDSQLSTLNSQPATTHHSSNPQSAIRNPQSFTLVFVGVLDYRANIEGLRWFCRDVWPGIRERIPQAEFRIVGRGAGEAVRKLAERPGLKLVGEVPDVRPPVWNADVVIAPLTIARGIQNKVLEAMAMGKPIVATPQAIEGTGAIPGLHLLAATTPEDWVTAVTELYQNPARGASLGAAARRDAEARFRWSARLEPLWQAVTEGVGPFRRSEVRGPRSEVGTGTALETTHHSPLTTHPVPTP